MMPVASSGNGGIAGGGLWASGESVEFASKPLGGGSPSGVGGYGRREPRGPKALAPRGGSGVRAHARRAAAVVLGGGPRRADLGHRAPERHPAAVRDRHRR